MKRIAFILFSSLLASNALYAEFEDNLGEEELIQPRDVSRAKPFALIGEYDYIGLSNFSTEPFTDEKISFSQGNGAFRSIIIYNPCCTEGILGEVGYSNTNINWRDNPFFDQGTFNTVNFALTLFTERLNKWLWTVRLAGGYDYDRNDFSEATVYDLMLWGRYTVNCNWGVHFGVLGQTGMRIDHVYPILGFDWTPNAKWEINIVYPVDMTIVYNMNCSWSFALGARFWDSRFRLAADEPIPNGLLVYRNAGVEMEARYHPNEWIKASVHAGYTTGGQLKVANQQYEDKLHFDFDAAPYIGGDLTIEF